MQTLLALGLLLAQVDFSEAERKLGEVLLKDRHSSSRIVIPDEFLVYIKNLVVKTPGAEKVRFEFISAKGDRPQSLPGGIIIVPVEFLLEKEWDFVTGLGMAIGHSVMRHGLKEMRGPGGPKLYLPNFTTTEVSAARQFGMETANRAGVKEESESPEFLKAQKALNSYRPR